MTKKRAVVKVISPHQVSRQQEEKPIAPLVSGILDALGHLADCDLARVLRVRCPVAVCDASDDALGWRTAIGRWSAVGGRSSVTHGLLAPSQGIQRWLATLARARRVDRSARVQRIADLARGRRRCTDTAGERRPKDQSHAPPPVPRAHESHPQPCLADAMLFKGAKSSRET